MRYADGVLWLGNGRTADIPDLWQPCEVEDLPGSLRELLPEAIGAWASREYWVGIGNARVAIARRDALPLCRLPDVLDIKHEFLGGGVTAAIVLPPRGRSLDGVVWIVEAIAPPPGYVDTLLC